jgi:folate-binding protein YgfZ
MVDPLKTAVLEVRAVVALTGKDRVKFLQGLVTNDVRRLAPGRPLYAGVLSGHGKLAADIILIEDGERILVDIAGDLVEDVLRRWTRFKLNAEVTFGRAESALAVAVAWGEGAAQRLGLGGGGQRSPAIQAGHAFVDPRIPQLGVRLVYDADAPLEAELDRLGFSPAAPSDYVRRRLALGVAETTDLGQETCYPLEANFADLKGVDFKKGCYVGQELTARMNLKGELRRRLLPVTSATPLPEPGAPVTAHGLEVGPLLAVRGALGLAMLRLDRLAAAGEGVLRAGDAPVAVQWPSWIPK